MLHIMKLSENNSPSSKKHRKAKLLLLGGALLYGSRTISPGIHVEPMDNIEQRNLDQLVQAEWSPVQTTWTLLESLQEVFRGNIWINISYEAVPHKYVVENSKIYKALPSMAPAAQKVMQKYLVDHASMPAPWSEPRLPLDPEILKKGLKVYLEKSEILDESSAMAYENALKAVLAFYHKEFGLPVEIVQDTSEATLKVLLFDGVCEVRNNPARCEPGAMAFTVFTTHVPPVIVVDNRRVDANSEYILDKIDKVLWKSAESFPSYHMNEFTYGERRDRLQKDITDDIYAITLLHEMAHAIGLHEHIPTHRDAEVRSFFASEAAAEIPPYIAAFGQSALEEIPPQNEGELPKLDISKKTSQLRNYIFRSSDPAIGLLHAAFAYYRERHELSWGTAPKSPK